MFDFFHIPLTTWMFFSPWLEKVVSFLLPASVLDLAAGTGVWFCRAVRGEGGAEGEAGTNRSDTRGVGSWWKWAAELVDVLGCKMKEIWKIPCLKWLA